MTEANNACEAELVKVGSKYKAEVERWTKQHAKIVPVRTWEGSPPQIYSADPNFDSTTTGSQRMLQLWKTTILEGLIHMVTGNWLSQNLMREHRKSNPEAEQEIKPSF